ncbi:conserved hypothetical protein [Chaetomium globosum CBS 148.51]|uniref:GTP cyclohydrolase N-terminal domain-containing protein n=1 Tax=Chaetomium globosum (strain ATCC 6205 / CBS 148.51 / DSM 1962 / NBRC 6347 / NRRL 1970) TaxID=306901 RepID=Q2GW54_CHAGB|nr:uncharacterized protein CHGG_07800 [Chaetomium globosum CBS 148.51]EAQ86547.1 conserved hypothetical protein [Chaetomium globosum CBS 148.51]
MPSSLDEVKEALKAISLGQTQLMSAVETVSRHVAELEKSQDEGRQRSGVAGTDGVKRTVTPLAGGITPSPSATLPAEAGTQTPPVVPQSPELKSAFSSRVVLTTYPKQIGIKPLPLEWGAADPLQRGPVTVSRVPSTIGKRNAIGAHGGSYSIYYALAVASRELKSDHRPDFTNTEPAVNIGPFPQWGDEKKIVAMDPWGHLANDVIVDLRPTIAITKAHMKLPELEESVKSGRLVPDGKVCLNNLGELSVTKFAVEPVWYLPGVAERFGIDEGTLRRSLFEHTGGMYPEVTAASTSGFFSSGLTVYCFGDPANMSDPSKKLALRIHDELLLQKLTRTQYLVYNARKRGEDRASDYFKRTENIAGVKDMRFQALMPDILHWLGITKIDRMLSMSNSSETGNADGPSHSIPIHERVELPESWIPADSRVEIDAKINAGLLQCFRPVSASFLTQVFPAGYFTTGHRMTEEELKSVQGRIWEE